MYTLAHLLEKYFSKRALSQTSLIFSTPPLSLPFVVLLASKSRSSSSPITSTLSNGKALLQGAGSPSVVRRLQFLRPIDMFRP